MEGKKIKKEEVKKEMDEKNAVINQDELTEDELTKISGGRRRGKVEAGKGFIS
ncbi:bacteriocin [Anaerotignum sp.]|uniref:bacteriocin n=1 Tax=Anaerotignum sp. TaxID=2039241 RepID=UPI00271469F6|nr:bacteriocin [Anaerotignum sp.]